MKLKYQIKKIFWFCHGRRNDLNKVGLNQLSDKFQVIGTDISDTAKNSKLIYVIAILTSPVNQFDFVYTNSFDQ